MKELESKIAAAITLAPKERTKALKSIRWRLKVSSITNDVYINSESLDGQYLTDIPSEATVFDGRDNQEMKLRYLGILTGETLEIELL